VSPSGDIADGSYPLSRPAQLVINQSALARIEVMSFIWYLMTDENYVSLEDAGFIGLSFADLANARSNLQTAFNEASAAALAPEATAEPALKRHPSRKPPAKPLLKQRLRLPTSGG
jgi:hypothetical protein